MDDGQAIHPRPLPFLLPSPTKNILQDIPPRQPRQPSRSPSSARNNTTISRARLLLATLAAFLALDGVQAADVTPTATTTTTEGDLGQIPGEGSLEPEGTPAPELPDFLCPALALVAPLPRPIPRTRTASEAYQSQAESQERNRRRNRKVCDTATALENSHRPYLVRSTFSTASLLSNFRSPSPSSSLFSSHNTLTTAHNDRPPLAEGQLILDNDAKSRGSRSETDDRKRRHNTASDNDSNVGNTRSPSSKFSSSRQKPKRDRKRRSGHSTNDFNNKLNKRSTDVDEGDTPINKCFELYTSRTIPDRYELGNDGRWHKLSVSSSCTPCQCESHDIDDAADTDLSSTGVVNADTSLEAEDSYTPGFPPSTSSTELDSRIVLPDGWDRSFDSVVYQVPLIVIASLLVAASVLGSVWFVFFWRRRQRTARRLSRERDLEKRKRGQENESDESGGEGDGGDDDVGRERRGRIPGGGVDVYSDGRRRPKTSEEKVKARWARATEKWKAHVRWIHRRKRGRASIIDGTKPRDAAMASGVSLARSVASVPPVSLTRLTVANSDSASASGRSRRSGSRPRPGRSNDIDERGESEGESPSSDSSSDGEGGVMTGTVRCRGTRDRRRSQSSSEERPSRASRDSGPGAYLDSRRSVVILPDQGRNRTQTISRRNGQNSNDGREVAYVCQHCLSRSRSIRSRSTHEADPVNGTTSSDDRRIPTTSSFISSTVSQNNIPHLTHREYDRPPPELSPTEMEAVSGRRLMNVEVDEDEVRQGPPAYRSRRSDDVVVGPGRYVSRRRRGRRRVDVAEKRASAAGTAAASGSGTRYLPAPEDYAPYCSSDDGEDAGSESETRSMASSSSSIRRSGRQAQLHGTTMHVAVDDKQALARLAAYASAPPPSSLSHPDSMLSTNFSSQLTSNASSSSPPDHTSSIRPNAPPEPEEEWERLEDHGYAYECDSPGAGPGPSTASARSRSASRSRSGSRPSSRSRISVPRASASPFPAPPAARPSKLAYAPADAGLSLPPVQPPQESDYGYGKLDFGLDLDSALDRVLSQGASAPPPFSASPSTTPVAPYPYDDVDLGIAPSAPHMEGRDGNMLIASAPPLFVDDDDRAPADLDTDGREQPSAPPVEDDLYVDDVDVGVLQRDKGANENLASTPIVEESQELKGSQNHEEAAKPSSPPSPSSPLPPEADHDAKNADRDAVLSAVR